MPLTIEWSPSARRDLARIIEYIAADNPAAAQKLRERLEGVVSPLSEHPYLFRPGRIAGTREIVAHPNYVIVYRVLSDRIRVSAVLHARQQYPK
jgi:toxin ParE1/3/4